MKIKTLILDKFRKLLTTETFDEKLAGLLKKHPKSGLLRRIIPANRLYKKGSRRVCERYGVNYSLDLSDYPDWSLYFYSEADSSMGLLSYAGADDVVLDIGGNIGQTALALARKIGENGKVISFEPYPETIKRFEANLKLNDDIKNVTLEKFGLGDKKTKVKMYQDCLTNSAGNRVLNSQREDTDGIVEVTVNVLDEYVAGKENLNTINLIKIDVEGFEMSVLRGAKETLLSRKPDLFIEVDDENLKNQGSSSAELLAFLKDLGYEIFDASNMKKVFAASDLSSHTDIYCAYAESAANRKS